MSVNHTAYFESGRWDVDGGRYGEANLATIRETALEFRMRRASSVEVQAFADMVGDPRANQLLSERRADAVRRALLAEGVLASTASAFGETSPAVPTPHGAPELRNRRAVMVFR